MTNSSRHRNASVSLLVDPLAFAAVLLMVVNDVWLKPAWHNAITGKLSDIAVCFVMPLFLTEVLTPLTRWVSERSLLDAASCATAVIYSILELSVTAARWTCNALSTIGPWLGIHRPFVMTRDPSDLWALLMIIAAVAWGRVKIANHQKREPIRAAY